MVIQVASTLLNGKSSSYFLCQASEGNLFLLNSLKHYVCISSSVRNNGFKTSIPCTALKLLLSLSLLDLTLYPDAPLNLHRNSDGSCTLLKLFINRRKAGRMSVKEKWEEGWDILLSVTKEIWCEQWLIFKLLLLQDCISYCGMGVKMVFSEERTCI